MTRRGSTMLGECDRSGFSELFTKTGRSVILPTTCKTWGCVVCRTKLMSLFRVRVQLGVSRLGRCGFMTLTYQADNAAHRDAASVRKDWQALWRRLRRHGHQWQWLRVTELTKQRIPHHHVVVGPVQGTIRCHGPQIKKGRQTARYIARIGSCDCLAHTFSREWWSITGDSFMCFATEVTDPKGAGSYMGKYMEKDFLNDNRSGRRFTTSRGWPGGERIRLKQTLEGGWDYIRQWPGSKIDSTIDINRLEADLMERVGDDLTLEWATQRSKQAAARRFEKILGRS